MCGIAGVRASVINESTVMDQLGLLRHRGPDAVGLHTGQEIAIGQTRLAVIDLVTGDPPISGENGRVAVAFNGEIYNFRQLRADLRRQGHEFKTDGDTEVIAHLAEDYDAMEVCRRLDGMFSIAVWDSRTETLWLGRDRLGKKPLYYWSSHGGEIVFASELKALFADPRVPRSLADDAIGAYLTFGYVPTPRTFFEGIQSVPPGHVMVSMTRRAPEVICYWDVPHPGGSGCDLSELTFEDAGREVRRLLTNAVEKRLVGDVPLGAFLSGGIDSSAVVALMTRLSHGWVKTFTIGFEDGEGFDERPYARRLASMYGTEHTEFVVNPDKVELIERLVWHYDQPFGDSSSLPMFLLSELTRRHVTVALCGDGGDELFGGYERLAAAALLERLAILPGGSISGLSKIGLRVPESLLGGRAASIRRALGRARDGNPRALLAWINYISPEWRAQLIPDASTWAIEDYERIWAGSVGADAVNRLLNLNIRTYLLDDLLPKADRMSMAHGLEVRSPFLDQELLEFAFLLPGSYKIRGWSMKRVLKEAVRDILPRDLLHRRKRGFGVPLDRWFRTELRSFAESMLTHKSSRVCEHLEPSSVRNLVSEHMSGFASHGHALWTLLTLEVFLRREGW